MTPADVIFIIIKIAAVSLIVTTVVEMLEADFGAADDQSEAPFHRHPEREQKQR